MGFLGLGNKGESASKSPKVRKERKPREPITKERLVEGLWAFARNALLVASVVGILVLAALVNILFRKVGAGSNDPVTANLTLAATGLTAGGGFVSLWLGRTWGIIPF